ncbi:hypothetical protein [Sphingopyxis sp. PET50]|uniref:hypothetical protein n=1 Tax=Sphingopyxis sp. PET50 TaxID=2976533 RepID=UPI0021AF5E09|nr:hypothetical protein [Sphingopyxis sp. PET50]
MFAQSDVDPAAERRRHQPRDGVTAGPVGPPRDIVARGLPVRPAHGVGDQHQLRVEAAVARRPQPHSGAARGVEIARLDRLFEHPPAQAGQVGRQARYGRQRRERHLRIARILGQPRPCERVQRRVAAVRRLRGERDRRRRRDQAKLTYSDNWGLRRLRG